jgi:ketosteroid isomerase-like protein
MLGVTAGLLTAPLSSEDNGGPGGQKAAVRQLVQNSHEGHAALMRGDLDGYRARISYSEDFSFFGPFGGDASRVDSFTDERMQAMANFFANGVHESHLVEVYDSPELVVLVLVERSTVEVGTVPRQDWWLRVTLVYKRDGDRWQLAHRHADPLRVGISLEQAAELSRRAPEQEP